MAQKNKQAPFGTQSSADAQRSEMFEASVLKSASMEAQQIVQEGEKEARQIVEQARHSSVDTQLDAYRRAAKRAAAPPLCRPRWRATGTPARRGPAACWCGKPIWMRWPAR